MVQNVRVYEQGTVPASDRGIQEAHYGEPAPMHRTHVAHPHWGSIFAGIFVALSTLAVLSALGAAVGASTYDPGDNARAWGVGSGIWAIISALISFAVGGFVAARTSGHTDRKNGLFQGLMVWAVAIPLLAFLAGSGLTRAATADARAGLTPNPVRVDGTRDTAEDVRKTAAKIAWGTLASLLLGLGAAVVGGHLGARGMPSAHDLKPHTETPKA